MQHRSLRHLAMVTATALGLLCAANIEMLAQKTGTSRTGSSRRTEPKKQTEKSDRLVTPTQGAEEPADLAVRTLNDSTGRTSEKRRPASPPAALTSSQLTRLRAADERIDNVIPFRGYPLSERLPAERRAVYAEAGMGLYTTARIAAGYSGESWPYDYSASARFLTTAGDPENSALRQFEATLAGGYIIGDSYGIFSGGHMGARAHYGSDRYRMYGAPEAPERTGDRTGIELTGGNTWRGIRFDARGGYRSLGLRDSTAIAERSVEGSLDLSQRFNEITLGGSADARWTISNDSSISYGELAAFAKYAFPSLSIQGGGALIVAGESDGTTLVRLAPRAEARLYLAGAITATAGIRSGVTQNTLSSLLGTNPYTSSSYSIRHDVSTFGYNAGVKIEPTRSLAFTADIRNTEYSQYAYFDSAVAGSFAPHYDKATIGSIDATIFWRIGENDELAALATFTKGTLGTPERAVPYLPGVVGEASYRKRLASIPLTLTTHIRFIGEREGGTGTTHDGVVLAGLEGRYQLTPQFDVALEFQNILNRQYELWDGYRERGIFAALGIKSRF
jgi:hypothetical protein